MMSKKKEDNLVWMADGGGGRKVNLNSLIPQGGPLNIPGWLRFVLTVLVVLVASTLLFLIIYFSKSV